MREKIPLVKRVLGAFQWGHLNLMSKIQCVEPQEMAIRDIYKSPITDELIAHWLVIPNADKTENF